MITPIQRLNERYPTLVVVLTWIIRIFVGGVFVFSGFTKAVDVWGTIFKFTDYFSAWGFEVWDALNLAGVMILCLAEFLTGLFLLFGLFRKATPVLALLIMAVMLPLTLWLAIKNPIADCGCFGDALKLTNWQTFYKNVVLTIGAIWLLFYNSKTIALITPYLQWIALLAAGGYLLAVEWIGYYYQPLIDFRPYKIGEELIDHRDTDEDYDNDADNMIFVYEKDGVKKEFTIDDVLPDEEDGWTFVERKYAESTPELPAVSQPEFKTPSEKSIRFFTEDGREDVTEDVIGNGRQLILFIPVLSDVTAAKTWKINSFYEWCKANDVEMLASVGGNPYQIALWKDISLAEYPIYTSDDTAIEEVVRGNPGIVYLEDGVVKWKSSLKAINIDDFQREDISSNPMNFARDNGRILGNLTLTLLIIYAILIFLSFSPKLLFKLFKHDKKKDAR